MRTVLLFAAFFVFSARSHAAPEDAPQTQPLSLEFHGQDHCLHFTGCIDGSDWIKVENGKLMHRHRNYQQIGTHPSCEPSLRFPNGGFLVDGKLVPARGVVEVGLANLESFKIVSARGPVTQIAKHVILIDDDSYYSAATYEIDLCGP